MELPGFSALPTGGLAGRWRCGVGLCTKSQLDEVRRFSLWTAHSVRTLVSDQSHGGSLVKMLGEKTAQKILFVSMIYLFLLSARLLLATRAGVLLGSLVIAGLTLWVTFRMVEHLVTGAWKLSGALAAQLIRRPAEVQVTDAKALESK